MKILLPGNGLSFRTTLQKAVTGVAVFFLVVAFLTAALISVENAKMFNLQTVKNSHAVLAELIKPALKISDYMEVQRLVGLVSSSNIVYSVITHERDVLLADYTQRSLIESLVGLAAFIDCSSLSGQSKYLSGRHWTIYCTPLEQVDPIAHVGLARGDFLMSAVEVPSLQISSNDFGKLLAILSLTLVISVLFLRQLIAKQLLQPIEELVEAVKLREFSVETNHSLVLNGKVPSEIDELRVSFNELLAMIYRNYLERQALQTNKALAEMAQQVAHDIRSPLAALGMLIQNSSDLPEGIRVPVRQSINRIRDIANSLLLKGNNNAAVNGADSSVLLLSILDMAVSEKRQQYRDKENINIELIASCEAYDQFVSVEPQELNRILSNIGNNAVEAVSSKGEVNFSLKRDGDFAVIEVADNGCGIRAEHLKKIGVRGFSFGKSESQESGFGLGIYHAKESLRRWGGALSIQSEFGKGSKVSISLPLTSPPKWFYPKIDARKFSKLVIFDDDQTIHQGWEKRLKHAQNNSQRFLQIVHLFSIDQFHSWVIQNADFLEDCFFLVDFEVAGDSRTGLDAIEQLRLHPNCVLVTSRFEEVLIQKRCESLGIGIVPKNMASFVPIEL